MIKPEKKEIQRNFMDRCRHRSKEIDKTAIKIKKRIGSNKSLHDIKLGLCSTLWEKAKLDKDIEEAIPKPPD